MQKDTDWVAEQKFIKGDMAGKIKKQWSYKGISGLGCYNSSGRDRDF